jgi:hypothetical protein
MTGGIDDLILHWGLCKKAGDWNECPMAQPNTKKFGDGKASQTVFTSSGVCLELSWPKSQQDFASMEFVFTDPSKNQWFSDSNKNFTIEFNPSNKKSGEGRKEVEGPMADKVAQIV